MATPLTDSINALTTYANEVTGASDTTLSDAVHTLANGYGGGSKIEELTLGVSLNPSFMNIVFPTTLKQLKIESMAYATAVNARFPTFILDSFKNNMVIESIIINYANKPQDVTDSFRGNYYTSLKQIVLNVDLSRCANWDRFLYGNAQNDGIEVTGTPINFSSLIRWNNTISLRGLKEIRFEPNTLSVSPTIADTYNCMFSSETWVSFANCLNGNTNGTMTIGSNAINTITNIIGNNDNGTFVADENGTMSLADFITTVKGWTLT